MRDRSNAISSPSGTPRPIIGGHRGPIGAPAPVTAPEAPQTAFVDLEGAENARLGVCYMFGKIEPIPNIISVAVEGVLGMTSQLMETPGKGVVDMVKTFSTTTGGSVEKVSWKESMGSGHKKATDSASAFGAWAADVLQKIVAEIRVKFREPKFIVGTMKGLISGFMRIFAKEAAPYVKGAMDMVKGLAKATPLIISRFRTWMLGRGVTLVEGLPTITVDALKDAMTISIFEGLYVAVKGAVDIALTTVTAGASAIAKVVIAFVEAAVKIVWRMFELFRLEEFCTWCRIAWGLKDASNAPHKDAAGFAQVYKKYAVSVPTIAALTLNSGICGDKMRFIQLFENDGTLITQTSFNNGVALLDGLKPYAGGLLRNMGFSFVIKDDFVKKLVEMAKAEPASLTPGAKILKVINDVLTF